MTGFLSRAQRLVLRNEVRRVEEANSRLRALCREFSGKNLHSQACRVGGMLRGACNGMSGESPCPCGADEDTELLTTSMAYQALGVEMP